MRARLTTARETMVEREYRNRVVEAAVANATVTVPPAMIERQAHELYHELESAVGERGLEMPQYLEALGKTKERSRPNCSRGPKPRSDVAWCSPPSATPSR